MTDRSGLYAVLVALLIPGGVGLFRSASLRTDLFNKWQDRSDEMRAGLTQGAIDRLLDVQQQTIDLLGSPGQRRLLFTFSADPAPLVAVVGEFQSAMRARNRLARRIKWLLRLGPWMVATSIAYLLGIVAMSVYFLQGYEAKWYRNVTVGCTAGSAAFGFMLVLLYVYLVGRLSSTELLVHALTHREPPEGDPSGEGE